MAKTAMEATGRVASARSCPRSFSSSIERSRREARTNGVNGKARPHGQEEGQRAKQVESNIPAVFEEDDPIVEAYDAKKARHVKKARVPPQREDEEHEPAQHEHERRFFGARSCQQEREDVLRARAPENGVIGQK